LQNKGNPKESHVMFLSSEKRENVYTQKKKQTVTRKIPRQTAKKGYKKKTTQAVSPGTIKNLSERKTTKNENLPSTACGVAAPMF